MESWKQTAGFRAAASIFFAVKETIPWSGTSLSTLRAQSAAVGKRAVTCCGTGNYRKTQQQGSRYEARAGRYATLDKGLTEQKINKFYSRLRIQALRNPHGANVRHALKWTPVIVTSVHEATGHAMVVIGHAAGTYQVVNPCYQMSVNFEPGAIHSCEAGSVSQDAAEIDEELKHFIWYW